MLDTDPLHEITRARGDPEMEAVPAELVERRRHHRDLGRIDGVGVQDAGTETDALGFRSERGKDDGRALQEKIIAYPELIEPRFLGRSSEANIVGNGEVVV